MSDLPGDTVPVFSSQLPGSCSLPAAPPAYWLSPAPVPSGSGVKPPRNEIQSVLPPVSTSRLPSPPSKLLGGTVTAADAAPAANASVIATAATSVARMRARGTAGEWTGPEMSVRMGILREDISTPSLFAAPARHNGPPGSFAVEVRQRAGGPVRTAPERPAPAAGAGAGTSPETAE